MRRTSRLAVVCAGVLCILGMARPSRAQAVTASFNGEVRLADVALPAGTYTFRMAGGSTGAKTVAVFDATGRLLTLAPVTMTTRVKKGPMVILDSSAGATRVAALYTNGGTTGYEFAYYDRAPGMLAAKEKTAPTTALVTVNKR
jgi:hypothetical protein